MYGGVNAASPEVHGVIQPGKLMQNNYVERSRVSNISTL